ncbi:MAG: hypothetical protein JWQ18_3341 [Conexibacter sp.]|nr:hypothetical protein [Conexibacter sp.]
MLAALLSLTLLCSAASAASAADRCQRRPGEHQLARSAPAVVVVRTVHVAGHFPRQTIIGCARQSGRRRVLDVLQRRYADDTTRLVGLRLAGTRVAYVRGFDVPDLPALTSVVADDAVHGGRRHDLGAPWPDLYARMSPQGATSWTVDAGGDVAWTTDERDTGDRLYVWRAGLGRRLVDARASLQSPALADGLLRWRRNGRLRSVDLATIPGSACPQRATIGTLDVDLRGGDPLGSVCLRSTGRSEEKGDENVDTHLMDLNGPYLVFDWSYHAFAGSFVSDLLHGPDSGLVPGETAFRWAPVNDAVVDKNGSLAWLDPAGGTRTLWVRDADGTRMIPGTGTGRLLRDASTVTWSGGGPTVTLDP